MALFWDVYRPSRRLVRLRVGALLNAPAFCRGAGGTVTSARALPYGLQQIPLCSLALRRGTHTELWPAACPGALADTRPAATTGNRPTIPGILADVGSCSVNRLALLERVLEGAVARDRRPPAFSSGRV